MILVIAVLLLRRLPAVLTLKPLLRLVRGRGDALFLSWFGPIGVAALCYDSLCMREARIEEAWPVASLLIRASILAHGVTASLVIRLYGRRIQGRDSGEKAEFVARRPRSAAEVRKRLARYPLASAFLASERYSQSNAPLRNGKDIVTCSLPKLNRAP